MRMSQPVREERTPLRAQIVHAILLRVTPRGSIAFSRSSASEDEFVHATGRGQLRKAGPDTETSANMDTKKAEPESPWKVSDD